MLRYKDVGGFVPPDRIVGFMPKKVIVAYSGGADSSLLLALAVEWAAENCVKLFAAHVDHGIRGSEAARDREHCVSEAEKYGVKCFVLCTDVPRFAEESGRSLEDAARKVRYEFFSEIMKRENIPLLLTAHNSDDNLETMLYRLAKGTSARGLCGIPARRKIDGGFVARPLLSLSKSEIVALCEGNNIEYVTDSTNADTEYARNRIRKNIVPELCKINPRAALAAERTARLIKEDCDFIDSLALEYMSGENARDAGELRKLKKPLLSRVLSAFYSEHSDEPLCEKHINLLAKLITDGKEGDSLSLPSKMRAVLRRGRLVFEADTERGTPKTKKCVKTIYKLILNDIYTDSPQFTPQIQDENGIVYNLFTQDTFKFDKIKGEIYFRNRLAGDKIRSCGVSKDVRKLFSEKKIPIEERESYPVVCDGNGILYIPFVACRDGTPHTAKDGNEKTIALAIYRGETIND